MHASSAISSLPVVCCGSGALGGPWSATGPRQAATTIGRAARQPRVEDPWRDGPPDQTLLPSPCQPDTVVGHHNICGHDQLKASDALEWPFLYHSAHHPQPRALSLLGQSQTTLFSSYFAAEEFLTRGLLREELCWRQDLTWASIRGSVPLRFRKRRVERREQYGHRPSHSCRPSPILC